MDCINCEGKEEEGMSEKLLRQVIQRSIMSERIVNFEGEDYDIPPEEVESIRAQLERAEEDEEGNISTRRYSADTSIEGIVKDFPEEKRAQARSIFNVFTKSGLKPILVKTINNAVESGEDMAADFFSEDASFGDHSFPSSTWQDLVRIQNSGRAHTIGQGEAALSLYLRGVAPDSGSGSHDLSIAGLGDVHVKENSSTLQKPDVPMGKSIDDTDKAAAWYRSIVNAVAPKKPPSGIGKTWVGENATRILEEFAKLTGVAEPLNYNQLADAWQKDIDDSFKNSISWGDAAAIIFVDKGSLNFHIAAPEEVTPWRLSAGKWRVGRKSAEPGGRWANGLKGGLNESAQDRNMKNLILRKAIREAILLEELTKADKKEIDKLVKKGIERDRAEQKRVIRKEIEAELKTSLGKSFFGNPGKVRKAIEEIARDELSREMKAGSQMEQSVVEITKKVLGAWHEMLYKQQNIINRIKIK